jgi:hypothetical protein
MKFIYAILICFFVGTGVYAQADRVAAPAVEEVYLARDNGKGKAGDQVSEFNTSDVPIYCVVLLETPAKVTVKMNFVAVSVSGVKPDTKVVSASYTTKEGQNRVNFSGRPEDKWTPGTYRVDIFLDDKIVKNVEFEIKNSGITTTAAKFVPVHGPPKPEPSKRKP